MDEILTFQEKHKCVLLGISPMSKLIIDAVIEYSNERKVPLMLVASRRQIDSLRFGGGYVEGWDSKKLAEYVRKKDKSGLIMICRDHGGPYQNDYERGFNIKRAMASAKKSFKEDIAAGFDLIHIDSGTDPHLINVNFSIAYRRLLELYDYCYSQSISQNRRILYEIGTEDQSNKLDFTQTKNLLEKISKFCLKKRYPLPTFIVVQIGTLVKELENIGEIREPDYHIKSLKTIVETCKKHKIQVKVHNCDYLENSYLVKIKESGVHSINLGPELATLHTKSLIKILDDNNLINEKDYFIKLAVSSNKWRKWIIDENRRITDLKKTIISGHYIFSSPKFKIFYRKIKKSLERKGVDIEKEIKNKLKDLIHSRCSTLGYFD